MFTVGKEDENGEVVYVHIAQPMKDGYLDAGFTTITYNQIFGGYIFDEDLSVKRNRELVQEHNDNVDRLWRYQTRIQGELNERLTYDVVVYMMENYSLTERRAKIVENFVYQHYHSSMNDYFGYIDTFAELAESLLNCEED